MLYLSSEVLQGGTQEDAPCPLRSALYTLGVFLLLMTY
jgi:hypothetical protein